VAVALAILALWVRFGLARRFPSRQRGALCAAASIMGLAISGMHYVATASSYFVRNGADTGAPIHGVDPLTMAVGITIATGLLLGLVMLVVTRRMAGELESKAQVEALWPGSCRRAWPPCKPVKPGTARSSKIRMTPSCC
jgi:sorbitol-specific phosphotransferase system component IIC